MKNYRFAVLISCICFLCCCSKKEVTKPVFMATSYPVYAILNEITNEAVQVEFIVPTGASPHTYAPKPGDVRKSSRAVCLFYIAPNYDGWITDIPSEKKISLINLLPDEKRIFFKFSDDHHADINAVHNENEIDPHFWFDPSAVKEIVKKLTDTICSFYPEKQNQFRTNAANFILSLDKIDAELKDLMENLSGKQVFLHHPSFNYLIKRYGLIYAGSIEEFPGKEPSPKFLTELSDKIKRSGVKAIFSEPQLNIKTAEVIAKESGVNVFNLYPEGNTETMKNYRDILIKNALIMKKALE